MQVKSVHHVVLSLWQLPPLQFDFVLHLFTVSLILIHVFLKTTVILKLFNINPNPSVIPYVHLLSVYSDKEPITLMNLEPSTRYRVRVQLSRPGEGGEGAPGPEAIMETDCPGKTQG